MNSWSLRGRIGAYSKWAKTEDWLAATEPARLGLAARFEREVDPDGALPMAERLRRADFARKAHMARLAYLSAKSRAKRAGRRHNTVGG